jgi:hypothetical protein
MITKPEDLTEENYLKEISILMRQQFFYASEELVSDATMWDENFISDDGTDYLTTALDACAALMHLRYEGTVEMARTWLFTTKEEWEKANYTIDCLVGIDSAGGLCNELEAIVEKMDPQ